VTERAPVVCVGCGRMARGIAVTFAYAGHSVIIVDVKTRSKEEFAKVADAALSEVRATFRSIARFGMYKEAAVV
jgi:3-hydroxybutyryl-CoA dehydrogenase